MEINMSDFFDDMVEILNPNIDINTGASRDKWNYGNYVEFPDSRSISDDQIESLLDYFGLEIPFGETISFEEALRGYLKGVYDVSDDMLDSFDYPYKEFNFPSINDSEIRELAIYLLIEVGAPIGETLYEDAGELPESYMYWNDSDDLFDQYSIEILNYKQEIELIKNKVASNNDALVKKSLILAAFVFTESFVRSKIISILPDLNSYDDVITRNILKKYFDDKLEKTAGRKELYKQYFGNFQTADELKKLSDIPHVKLRNILAHDISTSEVIGSRIRYSFIDNSREGSITEVEIEINELLEELITFSENLENTIVQ